MLGKIIKIIILLGVITGLIWFFDVDNFDFREAEEKNQNQIKNRLEEAPIIRNEEVNRFLDRDFEGTLDEIIVLANEARQAAGISPLIRNETLVQSAMAKAQDMKEKNYFEHVSPEGLQPWFFAEQLNYKYKTFGENLAEGFFSAKETHEGWMNSEGHRKNIMSPAFSEIGVAILDFEQNGLKSYLIVQHFGTQLTKTELEPQIICSKKNRADCEEAEEKKDEVNDTIEEQEDIIKEAKKEEVSEKALKELEDNLDKLEEIKDEIKDYLDECEDFIKECDKWE